MRSLLVSKILSDTTMHQELFRAVPERGETRPAGIRRRVKLKFHKIQSLWIKQMNFNCRIPGAPTGRVSRCPETAWPCSTCSWWWWSNWMNLTLVLQKQRFVFDQTTHFWSTTRFSTKHFAIFSILMSTNTFSLSTVFPSSPPPLSTSSQDSLKWRSWDCSLLFCSFSRFLWRLQYLWHLIPRSHPYMFGWIWARR